MKASLLAGIVLLAVLVAACGEGKPGATLTPTVTAIPAESSPTPSPTSTMGAPAMGKIAFVSGGDIYVTTADGTGLARLSTDGAASLLAWSPDGNPIAFFAVQHGSRCLCIINADGTGLTRLTEVPGQEYPFPPVWSPDGIRIAFEFNRSPGDLGGDIDIYATNADGSGLTNLTNNPASDGGPSWSPDGTRIAFVSNRDGNTEIYIMNADGTGLTRLTDNPAVDIEHAWSPDGSRIAFVSDRDGNWEVYVMNADGSAQANLTRNPGGDFSSPIGHHPLAWSPDGNRIAFLSDRDGNLEVYVVNADGTGLSRLTNNPADEFSPVWSPDGSHIAFVSNRDRTGEIYITEVDGSNLMRLTTNGGSQPVWRPASGE